MSEELDDKLNENSDNIELCSEDDSSEKLEELKMMKIRVKQKRNQNMSLIIITYLIMQTKRKKLLKKRKKPVFMK